jgi:uncharacterized protein (TIGR03437 family)
MSALLALVLAAAAAAQSVPQWRRVGGFGFDIHLASAAGGPAARVWFAADGSRLYARTALGRVFETADFETWQPSSATEPPETGTAAVDRLPSPNARVVSFGARLYALGDHLYRSEDGGKSWMNLTAYRGDAVIGNRQRSVAVSPRNPDEIAVANDFGVWRSLDGGLSWHGLNDALPGLTVARILSDSGAGRPMQVVVDRVGVFEFLPGSTWAWQPATQSAWRAEQDLLRSAESGLQTGLTAVARSGDVLYAGAADGRIWTSLDGGRTWPLLRPGNGLAVTRLFAARDGRLGLAAVGDQVFRTTNAGAFWDPLGSPGSPVLGLTASPADNVIYAATSRGVFTARADLQNAAPGEVTWAAVAGLPEGPARDVLLGANGNQLYAAIDGFGVYAARAPHRTNLRIVNAADWTDRPAAPGSLLTVLGARVSTAEAGPVRFPVLAASETESQLQVPFEIGGPEVALAIESAGRRTTVPLSVQPASPAIFVGADGAPLLLDGDTGLLLDAQNGARSNGRIQVLATGLGSVLPPWPTGLAAPLQDPPAVAKKVIAHLDRAPLTVTRATLAPGYIGFYLVEVQLPAIVNAGPAELFLSVDGQESNRVRVYLEP